MASNASQPRAWKRQHNMRQRQRQFGQQGQPTTAPLGTPATEQAMRMGQCSGSALSPPQINRLIIQAAESKNVRCLVQVVDAHLTDMNVVNISTSLYRFGKLASDAPAVRSRLSSEPSVARLVSAAYSCIAHTAPLLPSPQAISNIAWALASLQRREKDLLALLARVGMVAMSGLKHIELTSMLWAFAKLNCHTLLPQETETLFHAAAQHLRGSLGELELRGLSNVSWAYATARQHPEGWFKELAAAILPRAHLARCQEISNIVWAFGTAGHKDVAMLQALGNSAVLRLREFRGQEISNTLWGFAANSVHHAGFFQASIAAAQNMSLNSQQLANILWACARTRPNLPATRDAALALLPKCAVGIAKFKPLEVALVLLATSKIFGRSSESDGRKGQACQDEVLRFHSAMAPWAISRTGDFSIQSLANVLSALTELGLRDDATGFWAALEAEVHLRACSLRPSALILLLRSLLSDQQSHPSPSVRPLASFLCHSFPLRPSDAVSLRAVFACHAPARTREPSDQELLVWCRGLAADAGSPQQDDESDCLSDDSRSSASTMNYSVKNTFIDFDEPELVEMRRRAALFRSAPPRHTNSAEQSEEEDVTDEEELEHPCQWAQLRPEDAAWKQATRSTQPATTAAAAASNMEPAKVEGVSVGAAGVDPTQQQAQPPCVSIFSIKNTFIEVDGAEDADNEETELLTTEVRSRAFTFWSERADPGPRYVRRASCGEHQPSPWAPPTESPVAEDAGTSSAPLTAGHRRAPSQVGGTTLTVSSVRQKLRLSFARREVETDASAAPKRSVEEEEDDVETTIGQFSTSEASGSSEVSVFRL